MKKLMALALAFSLTFVLSAGAEMGIDGDGWFDDDYPGCLVLIENSGLMFRLPDGWTLKGSDEAGHSYFSQDEGIGLWTGAISEDKLHAFSDYCNNDPTEYSAAIILQQDRDWLIIVDNGMQTLIAVTWCEGFPGGMEMCFSHVAEPEQMVSARRIVSSVQSLP